MVVHPYNSTNGKGINPSFPPATDKIVGQFGFSSLGWAKVQEGKTLNSRLKEYCSGESFVY